MDKSFNERLQIFLDHPEMFIYSLEKEYAVAFMNGLEWGANTNFDLLEKIKLHFEKVHTIFGGPLGGPQQIQFYAEKKSGSWFEAFKETVEGIINSDYEREKE